MDDQLNQILPILFDIPFVKR